MPNRPIHSIVLFLIFMANATLAWLYDPRAMTSANSVSFLFTMNVGLGLYCLYYYFHVVRKIKKLMSGPVAEIGDKDVF